MMTEKEQVAEVSLLASTIHATIMGFHEGRQVPTCFRDPIAMAAVLTCYQGLVSIQPEPENALDGAIEFLAGKAGRETINRMRQYVEEKGGFTHG
jgi:hypothetical protein